MEQKQHHPRNKHLQRYHFSSLIQANPALKTFVHVNAYGIETIDFANPLAVKALNVALLKSFYNIQYWDIPAGYLCPPIPGRADYLHYMADLLAESNQNKVPMGPQVKVFDIGTGANCIYPIIGVSEYDWSFVGNDIDQRSLENANQIIQLNSSLHGRITLRKQTKKNQILTGTILEDEVFSLCICNPPFHHSKEDAILEAIAKWRKLNGNKKPDKTLNFGGQANEVSRPGGEMQFLFDLIYESTLYKNNFLWFTSLVAKQQHMPAVLRELRLAKATQTRTINMSHGNKISRIVAWTFQSPAQLEHWFERPL